MNSSSEFTSGTVQSSVDAWREAGQRTAAVDSPPQLTPFSGRARKALELTFREALRLGHNYIGTEHLLLALLKLEDGSGPLHQAGINKSRVEADPSIYFTRSRVDLAEGKIPETEFGRRIAHSYTSHGGWYVMVVPTAYQMEYMNGNQTTHFSPWSYDRHVPLGFFGEEFVPGLYRELVAPVDIAATFASILGVNAPSASVGRVLTEALRPSPSGTGTH